MIREMKSSDAGIIANYLYDEYEDIPNGRAIATNLRGIVASSKYRYVLETSDGLLIGYYVYSERTPHTAELSSVYIASKYRHTKYAKELWKHGAEALKGYELVKCNISYTGQQMPKKYYNSARKTFNIKKLYEKVK